MIGRDFLYEILKRISELEERIDGELSHPERLDLIRTRSLQPDIEYMFKHALTQEIVYNGLLNRQCREIHENIAWVMEKLFHDRLPEFYETLAFHFKKGRSVIKAVNYLILSGEKNLGRYSVEESHLYFKEAFDLLRKKTERTKVVEAIFIGERAREIYKRIPSDHYLFLKSLGGIGLASFHKGDSKRALEAGKTLLEYGEKNSNIRSTVLGHGIVGLGFFMDGELPSAIESCIKGVQTAQDPFYYQFAKGFLGGSYFFNGQLKEAETVLQEVASYSRDFGCEVIGTPSQVLLGIILLNKGQMGQGFKMIEQARRTYIENQRKFRVAQIELILGRIYLQMVVKSGTVSLTTMAKNISFILKNIRSAAKKTVEHFTSSIEIAKDIGAKGIEGQAYLDLGRLHKSKGRSDQAKECISKAARIFKNCEAEFYLKQAKEALES